MADKTIVALNVINPLHPTATNPIEKTIIHNSQQDIQNALNKVDQTLKTKYGVGADNNKGGSGNGNNNTYDPNTGVYTNNSGQGQSYPQAPVSSTIINAPKTQTTYTGGGTVAGLNLPTVTPPTIDKINLDQALLNLQVQGNVKGNTWIGNEQGFNQYNQQLNILNNEIKQYKNYHTNVAPLIKGTYENFEAGLNSGRIQGFSGSGLTPQQQSKKDFLENLGAIPKTPNPTEYFIDKSVPSRPINFVDIIKEPYLVAPYPEKYIPSKQIPNLVNDFKPLIEIYQNIYDNTNELALSPIRGAIKTGLYSGITPISLSLLSGNTKPMGITEDNKLTNSIGFNKDVPAYLDPDVQNLGITYGLTLLGAGALGKVGQVVGEGIYTGLFGKQTYETIKNPSEKNLIMEGLLATPLVIKGFNYVKLENLELPQESGEPVNIKMLGLETEKGRAFNIISKTPEGFEFGTPDIKEYIKNIPEGTDIKIGSGLETNTLINNLKNMDEATPRAKEIIPIAKDLIKETTKTNSKFIDKDLLYSPTERLPKEGVKAILNIAKEDEGVLFGSKSRAFQLAQDYNIHGVDYKLIKVPRDIELRFDEFGEEDLQKVTDKTISKLQNLGTIKENGNIFKLGTAREIEGKPFTIEADINGQFEKVAEFKGKENIIEQEEVPEKVLGFQKVGKTIKIEGIESTKLNEELRGVTQGAMRLTKKEGLIDIFPPEKRIKDIGSVSVSARTLQMSKPSLKLGNAIENFESFYPEELIREQVEKVLSEDEKILLADFRKQNNEMSLSDFSKTISSDISFSEISQSSYNNSSLSISPSLSVSPNLSLSPNKSVSKSTSPNKSMSNSFSPSLSISNSPYPSISPKSASPSQSPSKSISPSISTSPSPSPTIIPNINKEKYPFFYTDDLNNEFGLSSDKNAYEVFVKKAKSNIHPKSFKDYEQVSKPISKQDAKNEITYILTHSVARSGFIKPINRKPQKLGLDIPNDEYEMTINQFRPYKIRMGKHITISGIIKKSQYLQSTQDAKNQLSVFRALAKVKKVNNNEFSSMELDI